MRFKFLNKYYLFVSAVVVTVIFAWYYFETVSTSYQPSVDSFRENFKIQEEKLDKFLSFTADEIDEKEIHNQWLNHANGQEINIHIYRRDSLIYWNTNQVPIIRFADIHFPADGLLNLQNGWYFAKTKKVGNYFVCASFLVKHDYAYENKHLINSFSDFLSLSFQATIGIDKNEGYTVKSRDGNYVCSLIINEEQPIEPKESILLFLLLFGTIVLWLLAVASAQKIVKHKWSWTIPVSIIVLRVLSIQFFWFDFLIETEGFDPSLYGVNQWFPNFFEYLINSTVLVYLLFEIRQWIPKIKYGFFAKVFAITLAIVSILLWPLIVFFTQGLIEDSSIPLVIDQLFSLNIYSVLAITSVGVLFYAYFHYLRVILEFCKKQSILGSQLAVICFAVSCVYFLYEINYGYQLFFAAVFPMFFYGIGMYTVYRNKATHRLGTGLILLFGFSLVISLTIGEFGRRKEKGEKELYANQLATEKDIVTEVEYSKIVERLKEDKFLKRFVESPSFKMNSDLQENLERRFFNGFWEEYEMEFSIYDEEHLPLIDKRNYTTEDYNGLQNIIDSSGVSSEIDSNIYFISDYREQFSYVIRQELLGNDSTKAVLFCTLKSKKIPEEIGFPRLLISGQANVFESLEMYSIAKYHGSHLVTKYGEFNYPSSYLKMVPDETMESGFFNHDEFNHYILSKPSGDIIVLSSKIPTSLDILTSFSYLFSFYGLLLLPLLFRGKATTAGRRTLNLAMKIQIVLISLVFLSLLAFGWGSGVFVSNQYNHYTNDVIREKLNSVETEVGAKLGDYDELSITENGNFAQFYLQKFSRVFFTDINLYDANGYLLATSRPKVFNQGLISEQMDPEAYQNMKYGQKSEYVHYENIGRLNYSSAYQPFYNNEGKRLAFINLQHFGQQSEFENQIQKFLVAIINVFILLLAVSIILAILISNWLTAPLRLLQESFAAVRFGTHNEPISYNKEDEIGSLVKDYNQKLEELEFAAQQLARSERESAWREMAKQVAHEIKNPLTPMKLSVQQLQRTYNPDDPKSGDKLQKVANSIVEQIDALTKIANEFSSFAKMPIPSEERLELISLVKRVKEVFTVDSGPKITVRSDEYEIFIKADRDQIIRVFNNLIKNATQAIPQDYQGKITIDLKMESSAVLVTITDNGVGIEKSKLGKIFVPYFTTKSNGTGLGLAMVKQIVENHHGSIDFDTIEGKGTTFFIKLPLTL